jgi:hypothetical protein
VVAAAAVAGERPSAAESGYLSWMLLAGANLFVALAFVVRLRRARRWD